MIGRSSHIGNGLDFNGIDQYGQLPANASLDIQPQHAASFEVIMKSNIAGLGFFDELNFINTQYPTNNNGGYSFHVGNFGSGIAPIFEMNTAGNVRFVAIRTNTLLDPASTDYYHFCATKDVDEDRTNWKMYIQGIDDTRTAGANGLQPGDGIPFTNPQIARYRRGTGILYSEHTLFQLRVYDKQLSASEVFDLYNQKTPKELGLDGNLVLDLDFNQTSGNVAWDKSGNNNHGTLFNSPQWVDEKGNTAK